LTGNHPTEGEKEIDEADIGTSELGTDTTPLDQANPLDQISQTPSNELFPQHKSAEDVTMVAARQGADSTDWIEEFCSD